MTHKKRTPYSRADSAETPSNLRDVATVKTLSHLLNVAQCQKMSPSEQIRIIMQLVDCHDFQLFKEPIK
jgi:hypothetical protein